MRYNFIKNLVTPVLAAGAVTCTLGAALNPLLTSPPPAPAVTTAYVRPAPAVFNTPAYRKYAIGREHAWQPRHVVRHVQAQAVISSPPPTSSPPAAGSGIYTEAQLGVLWVDNGGPAADEPAAECIAEAESSGNPDADNGAGDLGLWQISQANDPGADLFNPEVNAAEAVRLFEAAGWEPWTTAPGCGV